ncbi:MAG: diaminopimelate epimerase [Proteobacteria bacterium]|nr:diaminopimelate epimerase [Pseudomonadota bacterium]
MNQKRRITRKKFLKMHGTGNDFVILDARTAAFSLDRETIRALTNRRTGIGCDQLLVIEASKQADAFMRIYNADGSQAAQCGNGTRCVAFLIMNEVGKDEVVIETGSGLLKCHKVPGGIAIDMGEPIFDWRKIPLSEQRDTLHLGLNMGALKDPAALSVGNPHIVFFVEDSGSINLETLGPKIENYFLFPERINVSVAEVRSRNEIRLRVWERGTGITLACGTAACATLVAAAGRDLTGRTATILMDGGNLAVEWRGDNRIVLSGAIETSFSGEMEIPAASQEEHVA